MGAVGFLLKTPYFLNTAHLHNQKRGEDRYMKIRYFFRTPHIGKKVFQLNRPIKAISLLFFMYMIGWGIVDPILPVYINHLFGTYLSVGIFMSSLQFFALFFSLAVGPLLNRVQKKSLISVALALYTSMSPLLLWVKTMVGFVVLRFYHSILLTTLWATSDAYVREHSTKHKEAQAIGLFDFSVGLAQVVGGILCALTIGFFGFNIIYAVSLFTFIALIRSLSLPDHKKQPKLLRCIGCISYTQIKKECSDALKNKAMTRLMFHSFPFYIGVSLMPMTIPLFVDYMGGSLPMVGIASALFYVPVLFESYFSTKKNSIHTSTLGIIGAAAFFLTMFFTTDVRFMFLLSFCIGIAFSAVHPIISGRFTEFMPKDEVGELSALVYGMKSLAAGIGPLLAGVIAEWMGIRYVFMVGFVLMGILIPFHSNILKIDETSIIRE